jgi:hypothetical protein
VMAAVLVWWWWWWWQWQCHWFGALHLRSLFVWNMAAHCWVIGVQCFQGAWWSHLQGSKHSTGLSDPCRWNHNIRRRSPSNALPHSTRIETSFFV